MPFNHQDILVTRYEGGPQYYTSIVALLSGREQRDQRWEHPLRRLMIDAECTTQAAIEYFQAAMLSICGKGRSFRFRDTLDWYVGGTIDGANTFQHGTPHLIQAADGDTTFQLVKRYTISGLNYERPICRPVDVRVYLNGVRQTTGWTVGDDTGIITFDAAPAEGTPVQWTGTFDLLCRLDTDEVRLQIHGDGSATWTGIPLAEVATW